MKRQLGIILLILMATVGLSTAASAVPVTPTTQGPATVSHVSHYPVFGHWVPIKRIWVHINPPLLYLVLFRYRSIYRPPLFRVTGAPIRPHLAVITIWRWVPYTHPIPRPLRR